MKIKIKGRRKRRGRGRLPKCHSTGWIFGWTHPSLHGDFPKGPGGLGSAAPVPLSTRGRGVGLARMGMLSSTGILL